jgi:threonine dehydratase
MIPAEWVEEAAARIGGFLYNTPLSYDKNLDLYFKWENQQRTGSFKFRGALNKVLSLSPEEISSGLITCSAGNHGQGVAVAAAHVGTRCVVFASDHAPQVKIEAMRALGAEVQLVNGGYVEAETRAISSAREGGNIFISPYNDPLVIAGQGTVAAEIDEQLGGFSKVKCMVIPVGGGGLLSGIGTYLQQHQERPSLIGVQSVASSFAHRLFTSGSQEGVEETDSIAEGLAGEIAYDSITIPLLLEYLDDVVLVSEVDIKQAIRYFWEEHHQVVEGSAAVGLAALLAGKINSSPALTIVTGGNIQPELFNAIIRRN